MLAQLDLLFMEDLFELSPPGTLAEGGYHKEELAEGFSLMFHALTRLRETDDWSLALLDPEKVSNGAYLEMLRAAATVRRFLEWEVLVDALGYVCERDKVRVDIRAPRAEIQKSLRLGYAIYSMQTTAFRSSAALKGAAMLDSLAARLFAAMRGRLIELRSQPLPRFVFKFPVLIESFREMLSGDALFFEEGSTIEFLAREQWTTPAELLEFELSDGITVLDLIKGQRVIDLLRRVCAFHYEPYLERDLPLVAQSLLPSMSRESLVTLLGSTVGGEKAAKLVDLLEWDAGGESFFDVQYQPFVRGESHYLIPINIVGASAIVRNSMQLARRRLGEDGTDDRLTDLLYRALLPVAQFVDKEIEYGRDGENGEIDVLAEVDGIVFAFECKQPLSPTGTHELRTTIDHLRKGSQQLDRLARCWTSAEFRRELRKRLRWSEAEGSPEIVTCTVNGNRMFSGSRIFGHPVRSGFELLAFIVEGVVTLRNHRIGVRRKGPTTGSALKRYLAGDSVHRLMLQSMVSTTRTTRIGRVEVHEEDFALDMVELLGAFGLKVDRDDFEREITEWVNSVSAARRGLRAKAMRGEAPVSHK